MSFDLCPSIELARGEVGKSSGLEVIAGEASWVASGERAPVCVALRYTPPSKLSIMHEIDVELLLGMFGMHDRDFMFLGELLWNLWLIFKCMSTIWPNEFVCFGF